jgi:hypothetical protein
MGPTRSVTVMHVDDSDELYHGDDAATGEYPVLFDSAKETTGTLLAMNGTPHEGATPAAEAGRGDEREVSSWLAHLESEIARLHARWQQVEQGFNAKDTLLATLKTELAQRDAALADRDTELETSAAACAALEHTLADKSATIAKLELEVEARGHAHERDVTALAAAGVELRASARELEAARAEVAALNGAIERERAAVVALTGRNDELLAAQAAMQQRLQELETYIDGRAQSWSSLKDEIAAQKSTILRLERGLKTREVTIEEGLRLKRELEQRLVELETQNAELNGRRQERDAAYEALERRLEEQLAVAERLQAELGQSRVQAEHETVLATELAAELAIRQSSVDLLQRSVHRINDLGASLADLERRIGSSSTVGADSVPAAPVAEPDLTELLPIDSFMTIGDVDRDASDDAPKLVLSLGGERLSYPLSKTEMTIGRGKSSDIRISSHFISRLHAKVSMRGIATMIEDVGSKNGIFVNAHRVKRCVLRDGDVVSLASELELKFVDATH